MTKHLILMMEVNGIFIINCEGRCISPQEKDIYCYFTITLPDVILTFMNRQKKRDF